MSTTSVSFYEQNKLELQVSTITQTMEVVERSPRQHLAPSFSATQIACSTTSVPHQENHEHLLPAVYGVSVNGDRKNPNSSEGVDGSKDFNGFPPGYRFQPTDIELILCYLMPKVQKTEYPSAPIRDVNLYENSPHKISESYKELTKGEGYFFTPRNRKYPNGERPNRATHGGYWKATGSDKPIVYNGKSIGSKKTLVYYDGEAKSRQAVKTNWIMHEYCLPHKTREMRNTIDMKLDDFVLCKIYEKGKKPSQTRESVEAQGLKGEVGDACTKGLHQDQENMKGFGDIEDHSSGFSDQGKNLQNSQQELCNIKDEVALARFDDLLIPNYDAYSMLCMDNPYTVSGGFIV